MFPLIKKVKKIFALNSPRILVLMYHRIADQETDPWQLSVSARNFEQQLIVLKKYFRVISMKELEHYLSIGKIPANSICLTFDDGYLNNFTQAKPILESFEIPATFFISSSFVQREKPFWWDSLAEIFFTDQPQTGKIQFNNIEGNFEFELEDIRGDQSYMDAINSWTWPNHPPNKRCETYLNAWEKLRPLPLGRIEEILEKLYSDLKVKKREASIGSYPMNIEELRMLADSKICTIGLHTDSHPALSMHPQEIQEKEIVNNSDFLFNLFGYHPAMIAYPYGDYNDKTLEIVRNLGLSLGFTTEEKPVVIQSSRHELGRFQVKNWTATQFKAELENWYLT